MVSIGGYLDYLMNFFYLDRNGAETNLVILLELLNNPKQLAIGAAAAILALVLYYLMSKQ